jgi:hypothetical protein
MTKGNPARDDAAGLQGRMSIDGDVALVDPTLPSTQAEFQAQLARLREANARAYAHRSPWRFEPRRPPFRGRRP